MGLFKELNHVSITVTDVAKAREFYTSVLGFQEIARPAFDFPGIWYSLNNGLRQVFVKDPDDNMVEFIGPTQSPSAIRRMES